jgi:hypothetical protein
MPSSKPSSAGFPRSRHRTERRAALAWRPSRWLLAGLVLLTVAAVFSLVASGLPGWLAVPGMLLAAGHGLALVLREARRPCRRFVFRATGEASVDGRRAQDMRVEWRGPLAFASWLEDGRRHRLSWWPDTLPAAARRELRLALPATRAGRAEDSMAP